MEYVYGFTSDNEKVIIGTVEEATAGYTITFPSSLGGNFTSLSINDGDAAAWSTYAGQTITGVEYLTITTMSSGYGISSANITGNNSFLYEYDDGDRTVSPINPVTSLVLSGMYDKYAKAHHILITPSQNTVFSSFTATASKS